MVGDDDQRLYRFRGATIQNILQFKDKFSDGECAEASGRTYKIIRGSDVMKDNYVFLFGDDPPPIQVSFTE